jgi:hypothetical protein
MILYYIPFDLIEYSFISFENAEPSLSNSFVGVSYSNTLPAKPWQVNFSLIIEQVAHKRNEISCFKYSVVSVTLTLIARPYLILICSGNPPSG